MTKEELIALSDLNREDNIKYISSEAQGIAIALDSDRYSPTLCKLERAYICGRRKSEKQIQIDAEQIRALQKQNGELTDELKALRESIKNYGAGCYENGLRNGKRKLEAQIEKMKCCYNCKHSRTEYEHCRTDKHEKWEIKEK